MLRNPFKKKKEESIITQKEISDISKKNESFVFQKENITSPKLKKVKHLEILLKHFLYIIYTAYLKDEDAVSTLIYAWQERGKSTVALAIKHSGLLIEDDFTSYGLNRKLKKLYDMKKLKQYHHLLVTDLEKISSRSRNVKNEIRAFLQTLMWDGIQTIDTYNLHVELDFRLKMSIICCVTPDVFNERSSYRRLGFLSRLIPFSFDYSNNIIDEIISFVGTFEEDKLRIETIKILSKKKELIFIPEKYMSLLDDKAKELAQVIDKFVTYYKDEFPDKERLIGSRAKKLLTCYLKAICLANRKDVHRNEVNEDDWKEFILMFNYFNFDMKKFEV